MSSLRLSSACCLALAAALALTACKTTEQLAREDRAKCLSLGAKPGTNAYVVCRLKVEEIREAKRAAGVAAGNAAVNNGLLVIQNSQ